MINIRKQKKRVSVNEDKTFKVIKQNAHHNTIVSNIGDDNTTNKEIRRPNLNVNIIEDYGGEKSIENIEQNKVQETQHQQQQQQQIDNIQSKLKPIQKLQESLITVSSPSRGSVLTNPQQPGGRFGSSLNNSNTQDSYPLKPGRAIQLFKTVLTDYETAEILNFREIYYVGENASSKKVTIFNLLIHIYRSKEAF